jgi:hypothetical protein
MLGMTGAEDLIPPPPKKTCHPERALRKVEGRVEGSVSPTSKDPFSIEYGFLAYARNDRCGRSKSIPHTKKILAYQGNNW